MLAYILVIAAVILLPVAARFIEGDRPDNMTEHTQEDAEPPDTSGDDLLMAA